MSVIKSKKRTGDFLVTESNGYRSRDTKVFPAGIDIEAGTLIGSITADGKCVKYAPTANNGSENVAGIVLGNVESADSDVRGVVIARDAEVASDLLVYSEGATAEEIATANTELEALGIIVR